MPSCYHFTDISSDDTACATPIHSQCALLHTFWQEAATYSAAQGPVDLKVVLNLACKLVQSLHHCPVTHPCALTGECSISEWPGRR